MKFKMLEDGAAAPVLPVGKRGNDHPLSDCQALPLMEGSVESAVLMKNGEKHAF
ncbi:MAG: hypothetical protein LBU11_01385 [Zoogloeaceae bacterium]|jgi:hypothetical protein|nr:hypothetical protein [Zoogloeaceae bacterium]